MMEKRDDMWIFPSQVIFLNFQVHKAFIFTLIIWFIFLLLLLFWAILAACGCSKAIDQTWAVAMIMPYPYNSLVHQGTPNLNNLNFHKTFRELDTYDEKIVNDEQIINFFVSTKNITQRIKLFYLLLLTQFVNECQKLK